MKLRYKRLLHNKPLQKLSSLKQQLFILMGMAGYWLIWTGLPTLCFKLLVWLGWAPHFVLGSCTLRIPLIFLGPAVQGHVPLTGMTELQLGKPSNLSALHASVLCLLQLYCQSKSYGQAPNQGVESIFCLPGGQSKSQNKIKEKSRGTLRSEQL